MKEVILVFIAMLIMAILIISGTLLLHVGNPLGFIPIIIVGAVYMWAYFHIKP